MSIFTKNFQKQKEILNSKHLDDITQGINRIRFIENRVNDKGNIVSKLLLTTRNITTAKTNNEKMFITNDLSSRILRRPLSQLQSRNQSKNRNIKQQNKLKAMKLKEEKKQILSAIKKRNQSEYLQKLVKKRTLQKQKQLGRTKMNAFLINRTISIKQLKQRKAEEKMQTILKGEQLIFKYEKNLAIAEKIKQLILEKIKTDTFQEPISSKQIQQISSILQTSK